jgi:hypothetical protein
MKAIDQGVINRGITVASIDQMFGTDFSKRLPAAGQPLEPGVVNFAEQPPPPPALAISLLNEWRRL